MLKRHSGSDIPFYRFNGGTMKKLVFYSLIVLFSISAGAQSSKNFNYDTKYSVYKVMGSHGKQPDGTKIYFVFIYKDNELKSTHVECTREDKVPETKFDDLRIFGDWNFCSGEDFRVYGIQKIKDVYLANWCYGYNAVSEACSDANSGSQFVLAPLPM
jgi:hypothetical protein